MKRKDICDCIAEEDRGWILIAFDEAIRKEDIAILEIRAAEERAIRLQLNETKGIDMYDFYEDTINIAGRVVKLHQDQITSYKTIRTRVENTTICK